MHASRSLRNTYCQLGVRVQSFYQRINFSAAYTASCGTGGDGAKPRDEPRKDDKDSNEQWQQAARKRLPTMTNYTRYTRERKYEHSATEKVQFFQVALLKCVFFDI